MYVLHVAYQHGGAVSHSIRVNKPNLGVNSSRRTHIYCADLSHYMSRDRDRYMRARISHVLCID